MKSGCCERSKFNDTVAHFASSQKKSSYARVIEDATRASNQALQPTASRRTTQLSHD